MFIHLECLFHLQHFYSIRIQRAIWPQRSMEIVVQVALNGTN